VQQATVPWSTTHSQFSSAANPFPFVEATLGYSQQSIRIVTLENNGTAALTGVSALITSGAAAFEIAAQPAASIPAGGSVNFNIRPRTGLAAGTHTGVLRISTGNGNPASIDVHLSFRVNAQDVAPAITTASMQGGTVGKEYFQGLLGTGTSPVTWSLDGGTLPPGLTISSFGFISGTPTAAGTYNFTVRAQNSVGHAASSFSITVTDGCNCIRGDVDGDGVVTSADVTMLRRFIANGNKPVSGWPE
jgi:hypothetical protein